MSTASTFDVSILSLSYTSFTMLSAVRFVESKTISIVCIYTFHDTYNGFIVLPAQLSAVRCSRLRG